MKKFVSQGAGTRNQRLIAEYNVTSTNPDGQKIESWVREFDVYAEVIPRAGREARFFEQMRAEVDHIIRILYSDNSKRIKPADWRLRDAATDRVWNIGSAYQIMEARAVIEMQCTEVVI